MIETFTGTTEGPDAAALRERARLSFDLDVDICIVGAGLAGLTVALEASRMGASVAVLEGRHVGWNASGHQLGTVMPGFGLPIGELIERIGFEDTQASCGTCRRRGPTMSAANATEENIPGIALSEGALEVSNVDVGDQLISRLQMLAEDFETEVEGWQIDRVRSELKTDRYFHGVYYPEGVPDRRPEICPRPRRDGAAGRRPDLRGHAGRLDRSLRHPQAHRHAVGAAARLAHRAGRQYPSRRAAAALVGNPVAGLALRRRHGAARRATRRDRGASRDR